MLRSLSPLILLLCVQAHAAELDPSRCAAIDDDAARLRCYDALARPALVASPQPTAAPAPTPSAAAPRADAEAAFGAEQLPDAPAEDDGRIDRIESRLVGRFEGWQSDTEFTLENGQVWRCVNCRSVYYIRDNPRVTIQRSFLGGYWLKVEGLNQRAAVRRVR